jgi:hypothetical protein
LPPSDTMGMRARVARLWERRDKPAWSYE